MNIAGIILAGGQSRRFGEPKALAVWDGKSFIQRSVEAMQAVAINIVIISHLEELQRMRNVIVTSDIEQYRGKGPLAGILTGMETTEADWYAVLPCDTPLVHKETMLMLVKQADDSTEAIIPVIDGRMQPLIALYHRNVKDRLRAQLDSGTLSMKAFLSLCRVKYVTERDLPFESASFMNVNTKEEYGKLQ